MKMSVVCRVVHTVTHFKFEPKTRSTAYFRDPRFSSSSFNTQLCHHNELPFAILMAIDVLEALNSLLIKGEKLQACAKRIKPTERLGRKLAFLAQQYAIP
jgi:hypothetical protein